MTITCPCPPVPASARACMRVPHSSFPRRQAPSAFEGLEIRCLVSHLAAGGHFAARGACLDESLSRTRHRCALSCRRRSSRQRSGHTTYTDFRTDPGVDLTDRGRRRGGAACGDLRLVCWVSRSCPRGRKQTCQCPKSHPPPRATKPSEIVLSRAARTITPITLAIATAPSVQTTQRYSHRSLKAGEAFRSSLISFVLSLLESFRRLLLPRLDRSPSAASRPARWRVGPALTS